MANYAWNEAFKENVEIPSCCIQVPGLPKGAKVEWQVFAVRSSEVIKADVYHWEDEELWYKHCELEYDNGIMISWCFGRKVMDHDPDAYFYERALHHLREPFVKGLKSVVFMRVFYSNDLLAENVMSKIKRWFDGEIPAIVFAPVSGVENNADISMFCFYKK